MPTCHPADRLLFAGTGTGPMQFSWAKSSLTEGDETAKPAREAHTNLRSLKQAHSPGLFAIDDSGQQMRYYPVQSAYGTLPCPPGFPGLSPACRSSPP